MGGAKLRRNEERREGGGGEGGKETPALMTCVFAFPPTFSANYTARNITDLLQAVDFTELAQAVNIRLLT